MCFNRKDIKVFVLDKFSIKVTSLFLFAFLFSQVHFAQKPINSYSFSTGTGIYGGDLGFSYTTLIGPNQDNATSGAVSLPFVFNFLGQTYTQFSVTENGLLTLLNPGDSPLTGNETTNDFAATIPSIKIAPYWDDLATGTNGYVKYAYYSYYNTMYVNWRVTVPKSTGGTVNAEFQVRLSPSGGIGFYYGSTVINSIATNTNGYSVGIGQSSTDFASVTFTGPQSATCTFGTSNNANTQSITAPFYVSFTPDNAGPTISNTTIPNIPGTDNRTITKTISDVGSGVDISESYLPRIYYKKNSGGSWVSTPGTLASGTSASGSWDFVVDHSLLGGVSQGDQIFYYVIAQDLALNVSSYPTGVVATDVNTITSPPANPSSYVIPLEFTGTKTVGVGGDFESLTNSGGLFDQLNSGTVIGNVNVNIISDLPTESGSISCNAWSEGAGGPFTVTIHPDGNRVITLSNPMTLNGPNGLIIDGLNDGTNSLNIIKPSGYGILVIQNGASNNIITRTTMEAYGGTTATYYILRVYNNSSTLINTNNTISYCTFKTTNSSSSGIYQAISLTGYSSTCEGLTIDNNKFINIYQYPIYKDNNGRFTNTTISNNEFYNTAAVSSNRYFIGIYMLGNSGNTDIYNNKIHNILFSSSNSTSSSAKAIMCSPTAGNIMNIYNNEISFDEITHNANSYIAINIYNAGTTNVYYNSIFIGGTDIITSYGSYGIYSYGSVAPTIMNNAIFNARSNSTGTAKHYGIYTTTTVASDYNDIYVSGTGGYFGYSGGDKLTLADWQTAISQDLHSFSSDPGFTSASNLQPDLNNSNSDILNDHGLPIASISSDILGNSRSTSLPTPTDIGAYEFTPFSLQEFTISGNTDIEHVTLSWFDGSDKQITSDEQGIYSITVPYDWSGTLTPALSGYIFNPLSIDFSNVSVNLTDQNFTASPFVLVSTKVMLEGPYNGTDMNTDLNAGSVIPLTSETAYPALTYNYTPKTVSEIPSGVVDWILVELRTGTSGDTKVATEAGLLLQDGTIVDTDGSSPVQFNSITSGNYYVVIHYKNHLSVMSAETVDLSYQ